MHNKRGTLLLFAAATAAALTLGFTDPVDARMGGGRSLGAQRQGIVPSRPTAAPAAAPTGNIAPSTQPAAAKAPAAAPSGASRWLGPIAGLAAGLGLAALMSHFGLSEGFGSLLLIGLGIMAAIFLLRAFMGRRPMPSQLQYAAAGSNDGARASAEPASIAAWSGAQQPTPNVASEPDAPAFGVARKPLPQGFDGDAFAKEAKRQYIQIQRSYDDGDRKALSAVLTSEMNAEIGRELDDRVGRHPTEIVTLDADVLDVSTEGSKYWASVRFTGLMREDGEALPKSVDEVWNLTKPVNGSTGWMLAGISQLA